MGDGKLLHRAILDQPDDDGARLVYADWLEEHGQPEWAEFIRCQLALFEAASPTPKGMTVWIDGYMRGLRDGELLARCKQLEERHRKEWFPWWNALHAGLEQRWHGLSDPAEFERGFVFLVVCTAADWWSYRREILAAHPVRRVELMTWPNMDPDSLDEHGKIELILPPRSQWRNSVLLSK